MTFVKFTAAAVTMAALALTGCSNDKPSTKTDGAKFDTKPVAAGFSPYVDGAGNISRPQGVLKSKKWTHLGSWGIVNEGGEGNGMHNVYTTYDVIKAYRETGAFPDGAVLVKEVRGVNAADMATGRAHWSGDMGVWFVMIKDATNRFPDNPLWGDGWGWALFKAEAPNTQVATDYKEDCLGCHVPAQGTDWVYVQGYPVLKQ